MRKILIITLLSVVMSLISACNKPDVKIVLPSNGCDVAACTTDPNDGNIYINGKPLGN